MGTVRGASPSRSPLLRFSHPVFQEEPARADFLRTFTEVVR